MVKAYVTGLPYLKRATEAFCRAQRPSWSADDVKWTAVTIWNGDNLVRDYYNARRGKKKEYPLPRTYLIPTFPYQETDAVFAKVNGTLPPLRDAAGNPVPIFVLPPPPPPPPPPPIDNYPFNFWPTPPWDVEPIDASLNDSLGAIKNNATSRDNWMSSQPHLWPLTNEEKWEGTRFLGGGGYGCAGLWCLTDATGNIVRHMVVKEVRTYPLAWRDPLKWHSRIPLEIRLHQLVDASRAAAAAELGDFCPPSHDNLIEHEGYRLMMRQRRYRIFMEYCEGNNLQQALDASFEQYRKKDSFSENSPERWNEETGCYKDEYGSLPPLIPEPWIWRVFGALVAACEVLHFGRAGQELARKGPVADWQEITHCDISLSNIFLQPQDDEEDEEDNEEKELPRIILSDFGLSFIDLDNPNPSTLPDMPRANPIDFVWSGNHPKYAPEHGGNPWRPMGEKTDVWQIGAIIFYLISNGFNSSNEGPHRAVDGVYRPIAGNADNPSVDYGRMGDPDLPDPFPTYMFPPFENYSRELKQLMATCLNWDPDHRPALLDIDNIIEDYLSNYPEYRDYRDIAPVQVGKEVEFRIGVSL